MQCFTCSTSRAPMSALSRAVSPAVGVCQSCGAGVCMTHAHRAGGPGTALRCPECARQGATPSVEPTQAGSRTGSRSPQYTAR